MSILRTTLPSIIITVVNQFIMTKADRGYALISPAYEPLPLQVTTEFRWLLPFAKIMRKYRLCTGKREEPSVVNLLLQ